MSRVFPLSTITDEKILNTLPLNAPSRLQEVFLDDLLGKRNLDIPGMDSIVKAWCRMVFALVFFCGLAGKNAIKELLGMRWKDIAPSGKGYIRIPRGKGYYPVIIPPVAQLAILGLCFHLLHMYQRTIHQKAAYPEDGLVLPNQLQPLIRLTETEILSWNETFAQWFFCLCRTARLNLSTPQFVRLSRALSARRYSPAVAAAIFGDLVPKPIPIAQIGITPNALDNLRAQIDTSGISRPSRLVYSPRLYQKPNQNIRSENRPIQQRHGRECWELPLRRIVAPYTRNEKRVAGKIHKAVLLELTRFRSGLERKYNHPHGEPWIIFLDRTVGDGSSLVKNLDLNILLMAAWMEKTIGKYPPNTCEARLNDLIIFARRIGSQPLWRMNVATILAVIGSFSISAESRRRLAATLRQFYGFLHREFGLPNINVPWWKFAADPVIAEYPILGDDELGRLFLDIREAFGELHPMTMALIIGVYFGLRISEICSLRIGDVYFSGTPTIFIWNSKRGCSRTVTAPDVPGWIISILNRYLSGRILEAKNDRKTQLFSGRGGNRLSPQSVRKIFSEAMLRSGVVINGNEKAPITHGFRHYYANRRFLSGDSLVEISRRLGHKTIATTGQSYLHTFVCRQYDQLRTNGGDEDRLFCTNAGLAEILGLSRRGTRYWVKRNIVRLLEESERRGPAKQYSIHTIIPALYRDVSFAGQVEE
jgi:integrase